VRYRDRVNLGDRAGGKGRCRAAHWRRISSGLGEEEGKRHKAADGVGVTAVVAGGKVFKKLKFDGL